jgi:hypothetical protein
LGNFKNDNKLIKKTNLREKENFMQVKNLDYISDNSPVYKKKSNMFIGATFAVMVIVVMIGFIFG